MQSNHMLKPTPNPCCCCSLKSGSTVIAVFEIIGGILGVILLSFALMYGNTAILEPGERSNYDDQYQQNGVYSYMGKGGSQHTIAPAVGEVKPMSTFTFIIVIIGIPLNAIVTIFGCLLIHAIQNKKERILGIWVAFRIGTMIYAIVVCAVQYLCTGEETGKEVAEVAIAMVISAWLISVVYYYREEIIVNAASGNGGGMVYKMPSNVHFA